MTDIFHNKILCGKCDVLMTPLHISKNGFNLRAISCPKCGSKTVHPKDEQEFNDFMNIKKKNFSVKMRFVGNSYAVSIPREIVDFMKMQEKMMDDMVNLCMEEFGRISLNFNGMDHNNNNGINGDHMNNMNNRNNSNHVNSLNREEINKLHKNER